MTKPTDQKTNDSYWKYLDENSKVVSTWPDWLKGDRSVATDQKPTEHPEKTDQDALAS